jgi:hypothetical protein
MEPRMTSRRRRLLIVLAQLVVGLLVVASYFAVLTHGFKVF